MKIGITERGDAGLDLSWYDKLCTVDGAIIITKNINDRFSELLLSATTPTILHCTCTGWGTTWMEPNVPEYSRQLDNLVNLIDRGYPADHVVLRADPIFLDMEGLRHFKYVLNYVSRQKIPISRIRISIFDDYPHVRRRMQDEIEEDRRWSSTQHAPEYMYEYLVNLLRGTPYSYETCAEDELARRLPEKVEAVGCISNRDLDIMNLDYSKELFSENPQGRKGCHCLSCKTELLKNKYQCAHGCLYCYWHDAPPY